MTNETTILTIDRTNPFDPLQFMPGKERTIHRQDQRSLSLNQVDIRDICLETGVRDGENYISDLERITRLKDEGYTLLDAKIFQALWENQDIIPDFWKKKDNGNPRYICFEGTVFSGTTYNGYWENLNGLSILYIFWSEGRSDGDLKQGWRYHWGSVLDIHVPSSAVIKT